MSTSQSSSGSGVRSVLLLGGTGKVGSRVAAELAATSVPTFQGSRAGVSTTEPKAANIFPVAFDWMDETTWGPALAKSSDTTTAGASDGFRSVFLVAPPIMELAPPMMKFIDLAQSKGVRRFVLLSASLLEGEEDATAMGKVHWYLKKLGNQGKLEWAALRPSWFQQNFVEQDNHVLPIRGEEKIYSATKKGHVPFVAAEDIAACGFRLLTQQDAPNDEYLITGPELLTYDDIAKTLTSVLGRKITHKSLTVPEFEARMTSQGMPAEYAKMMGSMEVAIEGGAEERLGGAVMAVTGRSPKTFLETAEQNKHVWIGGGE